MTPHSATAQSAARPGETSAFERALQLTMTTGRPILVGVTSNASPASRQMWKSLVSSSMAQTLSRTTQIVEVVAEVEPAQVERLGVKAPTFLLVRRVEGRLDLALRLSNPTDPYVVADWVAGLVQRGPGADVAGSSVANPADTTKTKDGGVARAGFHHEEASAPSSQGFSPPPPPVPQMQMQAPQYVAAPTFAAQPTQPGIVVPTQSPAVFVQQQPPTIVVGSPTSANVVYATTGTPNMGTPMLGMPAQPSGPMLGMPSQPSGPMLGAPSQPQPNLGTPVMAMPTLGAGVQNIQTIPTFGAGGGNNNAPVVGLMLQRPGIIRRLLGALGRELSNLGNPTVRMTNAPEISQIPLSAATLGALAPTAPAAIVHAAPQPASIVVQEAPEGQPSAQSEPPKKHSLFHR